MKMIADEKIYAESKKCIYPASANDVEVLTIPKPSL
jgi:hypothetical protein